MGLGDPWIDNMRFLVRRFPLLLANIQDFDHSCGSSCFGVSWWKGMAIHSTTFGGTLRKCTTLWQGLLDYVGIAWGQALKDAYRVAIHDDALGNFNKIWGGHKVLYQRTNTRQDGVEY